MTTRYCGIGGNDVSSGLTWALRKLTLNGVEDTPVVAGDVVYVGPGCYRERFVVDVAGGNTYVVGTVDVTNGSKQVDGNGTAFVGNVAADYMFHVVIYASGADGVANGTATFTSAGGSFQASMIGKVIQINARGAYLIGAVAAANSITLTDPNALGWPGAGGGLTYSVASGEGHYDVDSVDDNTTMQLKQPWNGPTLTAIAYITFNPIRYIADVTGENTDGVGGIVRITGSDNDQAAVRTDCISSVGSNRDYRVFRGFSLDTTTERLIDGSACDHWVTEDCIFQNGSTLSNIECRTNGTDWTLRRCVFFFTRGNHVHLNATVDIDNSGHVCENCLFGCAVTSAFRVSNYGDVMLRNCIFLGAGNFDVEMSAVPATGHPLVINNCILLCAENAAVRSAAVLGIMEDFNTFYANAVDRSNVGVGASSEIYPPLLLPPILHPGASQVSGFRLPWWFGHLSEWSAVRAITGSDEPSIDLHGVARPVTVSKNSWGPYQFMDVERDVGTVYDGIASLKLADAGRHQVFVPINAVSTTVTVRVYRGANYAGNSPQMIVKQPGQADDITTDAGAVSTWNELTTTLVPGGEVDFIVVELVSRNTAVGGNYATYFDSLGVA